MIDMSAATLALRNQMLLLSVCTTGPQTLSATATGYARTTGSFISDGFADGMEFTVSGFANNGTRVIESVTALTITTTPTTNPPAAETASAGRTISVGLPVGRSYENRGIYKPISGRPYIDEDFVPATNSLITAQAQGGTVTETGLYIVKWYGLEGKGELGIRRCTDALKALFAPGAAFVAGGVTLRVRTDTAVRAGQILPQGNGWALCSVTVPWWAMSINGAQDSDPADLMRAALQVTAPSGSVIMDYIDGVTRLIYTALDGTYALRWKMKTATSGAWGMSGVSAVRMFAAWDDVEVGITYGGGSWPAASATGTALGGGYRSTSTAGRFAEWTITGFSELWIAHAKRTNGGVTYVTIDGATTLVNDLPLNGANRELSMYAAVDDHNAYTQVAHGLNPATTYTVRCTNSATAGAGGGTFIHFSGYGYPSADLTNVRVNGVGVINNAILDRQFADTSYIWEYAYEIAPVGSSNYQFSGMKHENETLISSMFHDGAGAVVTVSLGTRRAVVDRLTCVQGLSTTHVDSGATAYASANVEQRFSSEGLEVWHRHFWLTPAGVRFAYPAMFAFDDSVTQGQVAGDYGVVYDLTRNDGSHWGNTNSRAAAMWNPAFPWVGWLYMPDFEGVNDFAGTTLKLWIEDRAISGGVLRDKIYYTRTDVPTAIIAGEVWENTARYRVSRVTNIASLFPLLAP